MVVVTGDPEASNPNAYVEFNGTDSYATLHTLATAGSAVTVVAEARFLSIISSVRFLFGTTAGSDYGICAGYGNWYSRDNSGSHVISAGATTNDYHIFTFDPYTTQTASVDASSYSFAGASFSSSGSPIGLGYNPYSAGYNGHFRVKNIKVYVSGVLTQEYYAEDVTGTTWPDRQGNFDMMLNNCTTGTEE
ncbi:MAG: hypothetical protein JXR25_10015 [Pontiellaceae bacterium]|nr:hypothetical protein [Pontiellaceae bacterium]MBN2785153.1 hypothetical protein [Pontiellaceae bacterium]